MDDLIKAISKMDVNQVATCLSHLETCQDKPKAIFMKWLELAFAEFANAGDKTLEFYPGNCEHCIGTRGYVFVGTVSNKHLFLTIITNSEKIEDIYECLYFYSKWQGFSDSEKVLLDKTTPYPF